MNHKPVATPLRSPASYDSWHVVLTPLWEPAPLRPGQTVPGQHLAGRMAWRLHVEGRELTLFGGVFYSSADRLSGLLLSAAPKRRPLAVWLPRGWEDLVGSEMGELLDRGDYVYRWAVLDGARTIFSGRLGRKRVDVTSLAAWTGGSWDAWRDDAQTMLARMDIVKNHEGDGVDFRNAAESVRTAVGTVALIVGAHTVLDVGRPRLSAGAGARQWWRIWGGPTLRVIDERPRKGKAKAKAKPRLVVAPLPLRPHAAAGHEGHCCYGLVREQYARGHVGGQVHLIDMASAYLAALAGNFLPTVYHGTLRGPTVKELASWMESQTGCALVKISSQDTPYPVSRAPDQPRAMGCYWTWLAGADLQMALKSGHVIAAATSHLWWELRSPLKRTNLLMSVKPGLVAAGQAHLAPVWRSLYAAMVGSWAQRRWKWEDVKMESQLGRWGTWTRARQQGDGLEHWRVVAGRVQRQVYSGEAPHALPLAYACVTAAIRQTIDGLRGRLPQHAVLATACDALWVTDEGRDAWQAIVADKMGLPGEFRAKDTYDDAWLDGEGGAVVRKGEWMFPLLPGVPHGVALSADGYASWQRPPQWIDGVELGPEGVRPRRIAKWDGGALVRSHSYPLRPVDPWQRLEQKALPEHLLMPYRPEGAWGDGEED